MRFCFTGRECKTDYTNVWCCVHSVTILVQLTMLQELEVNYNAVFKVSKKTLPLMLNVKAQGYSLNAYVMCEDSSGQRVEFSPSRKAKINFGEVC